jgi:mono/diheme cytochrome c family protein
MPAKLHASIVIAATCLIAAMGSSFAQVANSQRGHELAARLCVNCHVIEPDASGPMRADIPTFRVIANRPGATAEQLAGRIIIPHPAMPGVALTAGEIRDIVAYILTLKRNN